MAAMLVSQKKPMASANSFSLDVQYSGLKGDPTQVYTGDFQTVTGATLYWVKCDSNGSVSSVSQMNSFQVDSDQFSDNEAFIGKAVSSTSNGVTTVTRSGLEIITIQTSSFGTFDKSALYKCSMVFYTDFPSSVAAQDTSISSGDFYVMGNSVTVPTLQLISGPATDLTNVYFSCDWGNNLLAQKTLIIKDVTNTSLLGTMINFVTDSSWSNNENGVQTIVLCKNFPTGISASSTNANLAYKNDYCYVLYSSLNANNSYSITATTVTRGLVQSTSAPPVFFGYAPGQGNGPTINYIYNDANTKTFTVYFSKPTDQTSIKANGGAITQYKVTSGNGTSFTLAGNMVVSGEDVDNESDYYTYSINQSGVSLLSNYSVLDKTTGKITKTVFQQTVSGNLMDVSGYYAFTIPASSYPIISGSEYFGLTAVYGTDYSKTSIYATPVSFAVFPTIKAFSYSGYEKNTVQGTFLGTSNIFSNKYDFTLLGDAGSASLSDTANNFATDRIVLKWAYWDDWNAYTNPSSITVDDDGDAPASSTPSLSWTPLSSSGYSVAKNVDANQSVIPFSYTIAVTSPNNTWTAGRWIVLQASFGTSGNYSSPSLASFFYQIAPTLSNASLAISSTQLPGSSSADYYVSFANKTGNNAASVNFGCGDTSYTLKSAMTSALATKTSVTNAITAIKNLNIGSSPSSYTSTPNWVTTFKSNWSIILANIPSDSDERSNDYLFELYKKASDIAVKLDATISSPGDASNLSHTSLANIAETTAIKNSVDAVRNAYNASSFSASNYKLAVLQFIWQVISYYKVNNNNYFAEYVNAAYSNAATKYNRASNLDTLLNSQIEIPYKINGQSSTLYVLASQLADLYSTTGLRITPPTGMAFAVGTTISIPANTTIYAECKMMDKSITPADYSDVVNQSGLMTAYASTEGGATLGSSTQGGNASGTTVSKLPAPVVSVVPTTDGTLKYKIAESNTVNSYKVKYSINGGTPSAEHTITNIGIINGVITNASNDDWLITVASSSLADPSQTVASHGLTDLVQEVYYNTMTHNIGTFTEGDLITVTIVGHKDEVTATASSAGVSAMDSDAANFSLVSSSAATIDSIAFSTDDSNDIVTITVSNHGSAITSINTLNIYELPSSVEPVSDPYTQTNLAVSKKDFYSYNTYDANTDITNITNSSGLVDINSVVFDSASIAVDDYCSITSISASGQAARYGAAIPSKTVFALKYATKDLKANSQTQNGLIGVYVNIGYKQNTSSTSRAVFKLQSRS